MKTPITIAAIQHPPVFMNRDASLARAVELIGEAAAGGASLVVFPETWLPGYPVWLDYAPDVARWDHGPSKELFRILFENSVAAGDLGPVREAAAASGVTVVLGANERDGKSLYNTIWYVDTGGNIAGKHRKLIPTHGERLVWGRGDGSTLGVVDAPFGRLGGLVCWEHWMPLARAAMHSQHETIHVAQWPCVKEMALVASRHYAFEGRTFVIAAGCALTRRDVMEGCRRSGASGAAISMLDAMETDSELLLHGGSAVIDPSGTLVAGPAPVETGILFAKVNPRLVAEESMALDTSGHYARPDVFSLHVDTSIKKATMFGVEEKRPR